MSDKSITQMILEENDKQQKLVDGLIRKDEREKVILDIRKLLKDNSKTLSRESKMFAKAIIDLIKGRGRV